MLKAISLIRQLPGLVALKSSKSQILAMSSEMSKLIGVNNPFDAEGLFDEDIPCKACEMAEIFRQEDNLALKEDMITTLNILEYGNEGPNILYSQKKKISNENIYYQGQNILTTSDIFFKITSLFKADYKRFTLNKKSYYVKNTFNEFDLTERESQCLFYLMRGKSSKDIANILNISKRTVESHIVNIKNLIKLNKKSDLIEYAYSHGLQHIILKKLLANNMLSILLN